MTLAALPTPWLAFSLAVCTAISKRASGLALLRAAGLSLHSVVERVVLTVAGFAFIFAIVRLRTRLA